MADLHERTILVTGSTGQVGFELLRSLQGLGRIVAPGRQAFDLSDFDQMRRVVREIKPSLIVNPAAYTAVDQAETDVDAAMRMNGEAPGVLAEEARRVGAALFHFSTDYVFDGTKDGAYEEGDPTGPLNVYGKSKLAGERAIEQVGGKYFVLRTSWVYGTRGRNFLRTMLRLAAERSELSIVADQVGAPTWSGTIAALTAHIATQALVEHLHDDRWWSERFGIYHLTATGVTSWAEFAKAIFELAPLAQRPTINAITSDLYPTPAMRPKNSRLSNAKLLTAFDLRAPDWKTALGVCVGTM
ncbi:dTDP-4-dehydrorhamnose reductase [Paraburkholderia gardini]|uniref:dTDP-4-dehydrorhamnose reductase n=1 Tax=Paraburkholderia gardini TaxID=2823469 RepID=A0ABN7QCI7_9BURK|nr:dTDP-4-dehydrorhamnose reductase [Paraburkholderia gardini]CAG4885506.1 dTDP-4-dehydrorhamnose reductase [Paraburkholderia gardini]